MSTEVKAQLSPEEQKQKYALYLKWGLALGVGLLVSPFIFHALVGLVGLGIAFILCAGGTIALQQLMPYFSLKMANTVMDLLQREARKNPILTMRTIYMDNCKTIKEKDEKISEFEARLNDFIDKMNSFAKKYPKEVDRYKAVAAKMQTLLARMKDKQRAAKMEANNYKAEIDKAEAIFAMSNAASDVVDMAGELDKKVVQQILKQVAFDEVNHRFNKAVADLSVAADTETDFTVSFDAPEAAAIAADATNSTQTEKRMTT